MAPSVWYYTLGQKAKKSDFEYQGDVYKVKTFYEITKLERNDLFVYESVPGTVAEHFLVSDEGVEFSVEGAKDARSLYSWRMTQTTRCM